jgi:hypothetical protein
MPIEYTLSHEGSVVFVWASGRVTTREMLDYLDALEADPDLGTTHITLFDARKVTEMDFDTDHFRKIAEKEQSCPHKMVARKLAFVVSDIESFKSSVRWIQQAEVFKESTMVFHDPVSAKIWLGIRK